MNNKIIIAKHTIKITIFTLKDNKFDKIEKDDSI